MFTTTAPDGIDVRAYEQGAGPPVVILGPGTDDGTRTAKLGELLADRFHVLRLHRRQYRLDLKADPRAGSPCSIREEVDDVLAVTEALGEPAVLYGHSSGGIVALETLVRSPGSFVGAVLYEPPVITSRLGLGADALERMRTALTRGRPGRAYGIFARESLELSRPVATLVGLVIGLVPKYRRLAPFQIDDLETIIRLGDRIDTYAGIQLPCVLLGGGRSPANLGDRLDALEEALRDAERVTMPQQGHAADAKSPADVARVIELLADRVLPG